MTQNLANDTANHAMPNRQTRTQLRAEAEKALRDLAFVLKMTQRIRAEIEAKEEADELVPA